VNSAKSYTLDIRLPEGVTFTLPLAGPVSRFLAWLVDLVLYTSIGGALSRVLIPLMALAPDIGLALNVLMIFAVPIAYGIVCEGFWRGQTPGKRLLRLRVMDSGGLRLDLRQVIIRNLLRFVDMLPQLYLVGGIVCLCSARAQRLGDIAAGTVVVRTPRPFEPDLAQLAAGKYNTLRDHPALIARLRQRISPAEASIALQALLRRNELEAAARIELFARLAARFRAAAPLPEGLVEDLTDEMYVRNVTDILFRARATATGG
jgi:uncharacterized RDD family membrane protein YckC